VLGSHIRQHGAPDPDKLIMNLDARRAPVLDADLGHFGVADDRTPVCGEAISHCVRESAGAALGNWIPDGLTEHDQQQTEEARAGTI
jgi:hypothetical protein